MKKFIYFLTCAAMMLVGLAAFSSCGDKTPTAWSKAEIEEICTDCCHSVLFDNTSPTFYNVGEVLENIQSHQSEQSTDSIFYNMPLPILKNVASVCIKKFGDVNKKQIVDEYTNNKTVYVNLPNSNDASASTKDEKAATDSGGSDVTKDNSVFSTEYQIYTDSSTGKKIQMKIEKSYVK